MPAVKIDYEPLDYQHTFHYSTKSKVYLSAGWGAGKTYSLIMKMFRLMNINRGIPGGILVPTLKMYKRDVLPTIREICAESGIAPEYNKTEATWYFKETNSIVYIFYSDDDGQSIRGPNLGWFGINEVSLCSRMSFLSAIGRVRVKNAALRQIFMSGTPESFDWCYEYFIENPREDTDLIYGDVTKNFHVSDDYVQMLRDSYDPLMQKQYIEGIPVNMNKKACAYAFNRKKHVDPSIEKLPGYPVWVSLDFNVTPMAATLWNRVPFGRTVTRGVESYSHELRAFDEICIDGSNTYELCDVLKSKLSPGDDVTIYPDPTGSARSTKSRGQSDISILKDYGKFDQVKYRKTIRVRDCLNALNAKFSKDMIVLNPRCRQSIADYEQCSFREGSFEIDKSNLRRTHWLDGTKNMVGYEFPIGGRRAHYSLRLK